jgi:transcriptional regulator with XRE-family HTH domain
MRLSKQVVPEAVRAELVQLGGQLRAARMARGLSQADIARRLRVSIPTIQAIERGAFGSASGTVLGFMWMLDLKLPSGYVEQQLELPSFQQRARRRVVDEGLDV